MHVFVLLSILALNVMLMHFPSCWIINGSDSIFGLGLSIDVRFWFISSFFSIFNFSVIEILESFSYWWNFVRIWFSYFVFFFYSVWIRKLCDKLDNSFVLFICFLIDDVCCYIWEFVVVVICVLIEGGGVNSPSHYIFYSWVFLFVLFFVFCK